MHNTDVPHLQHVKILLQKWAPLQSAHTLLTLFTLCYTWPVTHSALRIPVQSTCTVLFPQFSQNAAVICIAVWRIREIFASIARCSWHRNIRYRCCYTSSSGRGM